MQRSLAIFSGVLAAVSILAGAAASDDHREGRGEERRGGSPAGYSERGPSREGGGEFRGAQGGGRERGGGEYRGAPVGGGYAPEPRFQPRYQPPYQENYAPPRRSNSLGADWRQQQEQARSGVRQGQMAPLGSVIAGIGHRAAGRPLDAGIEYQGSRAVYRVRWLMNNGRRVDYLVDAATGQILSEH